MIGQLMGLSLILVMSMTENGGPAAADMYRDSLPIILTQKKPHDPGNCFHWKGCRGDSIGAMWMYDPDRCKSVGGKSWMADTGECFNLPDGKQVVRIPPPRS